MFCIIILMLTGCGVGSAGRHGGNGGAPCFHPDTKVLMADNTLKKIADIKVGEAVKAYDTATRLAVNSTVVKVYEGRTDQYYIINKRVKVAPPHPFFNTDGRWIKIADLKIGDKIKSIVGFSEITSINIEKKGLKLNNIIVNKFSNFYVQDIDDSYFLVHQGD